jgi:hypothetical protein
VVHFPSGQPLAPLPADNLGADHLRAGASVRALTETAAAAPGDTISVQSVHAALELGLMNHQDPNSLPAAGAADYQLARAAAVTSEPVVSMHHLELAVHESPAFASVALQDPAFQAMRGPVQELVDRVTLVAATSQSAPAGTYQTTPVIPPMPVPTGDAPAPWEQPLRQAAPETDGVSVAGPPVPAPQPGRPIDSLPQAPAPSTALALPRVITAALDLGLLRSWDSVTARASSADQYQLARSAMQAGDRPAALQHLEQSILAHPAQAATALTDPTFDAIKGSVRDLVTRVIVAARVGAETSISEAHAALQSASTTEIPRPLARVYLQAAQASFQLGTYTGLVQATFAADLAKRIATRKISLAIPRTGPGAIGEVKNAVTRAARRLWRKLPLLAILLGWFIAGIVAGITSLAFPSGAALRAWLLPAWAMGLLAIVLVGFVRSIRRRSRGSR